MVKRHHFKTIFFNVRWTGKSFLLFVYIFAFGETLTEQLYLDLLPSEQPAAKALD